LTAAGGGYEPAAYKLGLALCCVAFPCLFFLAARSAGLGGGAAALATALGLLVCWGTPGRQLLEAGDLDLLLAALAALAQACLLVRFDREPGVLGWGGIFALSCVGWFTHPLLFAGTVILVLVYYISVGARHSLGWHLALLGGLAGGLAVNSFWLID